MEASQGRNLGARTEAEAKKEWFLTGFLQVAFFVPQGYLPRGETDDQQGNEHGE